MLIISGTCLEQGARPNTGHNIITGHIDVGNIFIRRE